MLHCLFPAAQMFECALQLQVSWQVSTMIRSVENQLPEAPWHAVRACSHDILDNTYSYTCSQQLKQIEIEIPASPELRAVRASDTCRSHFSGSEKTLQQTVLCARLGKPVATRASQWKQTLNTFLCEYGCTTHRTNESSPAQPMIQRHIGAKATGPVGIPSLQMASIYKRSQHSHIE